MVVEEFSKLKSKLKSKFNLKSKKKSKSKNEKSKINNSKLMSSVENNTHRLTEKELKNLSKSELNAIISSLQNTDTSLNLLYKNEIGKNTKLSSDVVNLNSDKSKLQADNENIKIEKENLSKNLSITNDNLNASTDFGKSILYTNVDLNSQILDNAEKMITVEKKLYGEIESQNEALKKDIKNARDNFSTDEQKSFYQSAQIDYLKKINGYLFLFYYLIIKSCKNKKVIKKPF